MEMIKGAQWEYLTALGERIDGRTTKADASSLIDHAKSRLGHKATRDQHRLERSWGVSLPDDATRGEATDILYRFIIARRWTYSVVRKIAGAEDAWRRYEDSRLSEQKINVIAHAVLGDSALAKTAESATRGASFTGSAWNRFTAKAVESEAFRLTAAMLEQHMARELAKARKSMRGGCLTVVAVVCSAALIAFWVMLN